MTDTCVDLSPLGMDLSVPFAWHSSVPWRETLEASADAASTDFWGGVGGHLGDVEDGDKPDRGASVAILEMTRKKTK